jgi:hypothetical protein
MSQKETTATVGRLEAGESQVGNLSEWTERAREAFEQKRTKDCLDLTRAILLVDPGNSDAQSMRLSIQSEMHRDLDSARAFIRQAQSKESLAPQPQPCAAEVEERSAYKTGKSRAQALVDSAVLLLSDLVHAQRLRGLRWLVVAAALIIAGVVLAPFPRFKTDARPAKSSLLALGSSDVPKPPVSEDIRLPLMEASANPMPDPTAIPAKNLPRAPTPVPIPTLRPDVAVADIPVVASTGTLAVSSSTAVDIYEGDAYLGSVPVSLELSTGEHTLEYRHGSLRKVMTHVIHRNETVKTMVVFEVSVQVNSKPWSEVFLDGVERRDLGQTPLSGVRVPIGGVLVFENPQFQAKRYRITGNETGIQVVFP